VTLFFFCFLFVPSSFINHPICAASILRLSSFLRIHHSALYRNTDRTKTSYKLLFVWTLTCLSFYIFFKVCNSEHAFQILFRISFWHDPYLVNTAPICVTFCTIFNFSFVRLYTVSVSPHYFGLFCVNHLVS